MEIGGENAVLWSKIEALDLTAVRARLMDPRRGTGWNGEQTDRAITHYRRFLFLAGTADMPVVPTREIDEVWHTHVLHTWRYARDCERLFGRFIHHAPTPPDAPEAERERLRNEFARTGEIYRAAFGEEYATSGAGTCDGDECGVRSCDENCDFKPAPRPPANCTECEEARASDAGDCEDQCGVLAHPGAAT